jgi:hypothetical protein
MSFPGDVVLVPSMQHKPKVESEEESATPAAPMLRPRFDPDGAAYYYRLFMRLAQTMPANWSIYIPQVGGLPLNIDAFGPGPQVVDVLPPASEHADTSDPYSVLPKQLWVSLEPVCFGKSALNADANLRPAIQSALTGALAFGIAGVDYEPGQ